MRTIVGLGFLLVTSSALAETHIEVTAISKHFSTQAYNERNWGAGVEIGDARGSVTLGTFTNSYHKQAQYLAASHEVVVGKPDRRLAFGVALGVVHGYAGTPGQLAGFGTVQPLALPYVELGTERLSARVGLFGPALVLQLTCKL